MNKQHAELNILPVNKTVVFYSPIEGNDVLVRTGTVGDGSCFFHCVLHAFSKEYPILDAKGRAKLVKKLHSSLSSKLDRQRWDEISDGLVAKIPFQEHLKDALTDFYNHVSKGKVGKTSIGRNLIREIYNDKNKGVFEIIQEILPLTHLETTLLPKCYDSCADEKLEKCKREITKQSVEHIEKELKKFGSGIGDDKRKYCIDKGKTLFLTAVNEAEEYAYRDYTKNLDDNTVLVDPFSIELVSNRFNRDLYFIDSKTRMPYKLGSEKNIRKRKSMILIFLNSDHYEVVGRLLPGNKIQREFEPDDPIIRRIYTFLYNSEKISSRYPELTPYLRNKKSSSSEREYSRSKSTEEDSESNSSDDESSQGSDASSQESDSSRSSESESSQESDESSRESSQESDESSEESSQGSDKPHKSNESDSSGSRESNLKKASKSSSNSHSRKKTEPRKRSAKLSKIFETRRKKH